MQLSQFTLEPTVVNTINDLNIHFRDRNFIISDIIDDEGHQYVDLVQEGGGILGIALLGYTYVLEQMGIRFLSFGGTSAGAINSILMAAYSTPVEEKSCRLIELLANKDLNEFIDGDDDAKEFIKALNSDDRGLLKLIFTGAQVIDNFKKDLGLNPGDAFHKWLKKVLEKQGVYDTPSLLNKMNQYPGSIRHRALRSDLDKNFKILSKLAIIASEINTETKVVFPDMRDLFYKIPDQAHPADYVRASMSIPLFFSPFVIEDLPKDENIIKNWTWKAKHRGGVPEKAIFIDGGVMSNFPIEIFHRPGLPSRPTLGVKLGLERVENNDIQTIGGLIFGCFDAARNLRDFEFINNNPDYKNLVKYIDTKDHDWLDFDVSDEVKLDLFKQGAIAAKDFLINFDWDNYKEIRATLRDSFYSDATINKMFGLLNKIIINKNQPIGENDIEVLQKRILSISKSIDLNILWVDDFLGVNMPEKKMLELIGIKSTHVTSTLEANSILETESYKYDLIISDVVRNDNRNEGIQFAKYVSNTYPKFKQNIIFYIRGFDAGLGVPPYAFGVTDSCVELTQFILDLICRKD